MADPFPNRHLAPIFDELLPALEEAAIPYWVCGGVGVAGGVGRFVRENKDVDAYVREADFDATRAVVNGLCPSRGWELGDAKPLRGRRKFYVNIRGRERFSAVPVFDTSSGIEYRTDISLTLPPGAFERELREVAGFKFFAPPIAVAKALLRSFYVEHPKKFSLGSRRHTDAIALFTSSELEEIEAEIRRQRRD